MAVQGFEGTDILQHPPSPEPFHPGFVDAVPMIIGLTELDDAPGVRILTNIVGADPAELRCGLPMEVVFEQREEFALPQFRPYARTSRRGARPRRAPPVRVLRGHV